MNLIRFGIIALITVILSPSAFAGETINASTGLSDYCVDFAEEDGDPLQICPNRILVPNGSLTDNGDGTTSFDPSSTVADGDKGDITVSGSGLTWTIDNDAVTDAKVVDTITASNYLPLTGGTMTGDINAGSIDITALDNLQFDTTPTTPLTTEGSIYWDSTNHTLGIHPDEADSTLQTGQENWIRVYNNSGVTINNGEVVYASGKEDTENRLTIAKAQADADNTSRVLGFATHSIEDSTFGYVTQFGYVNGLNTASIADGSPIWLSDTTAGGITATNPQSPNNSVFLGFVVDSDASTGNVFITTLGNTSGDNVIQESNSIVVPARKGSVGTINKGQAVYITGFNTGQNVVEVELADADGSSTYPAIGIADDSITNSANGNVVIYGRIANVNTLGMTVNDALFLSTTAGALTTTRPTGVGACIQSIARVLRVSATVGVIDVIGAGRCNDVPNLQDARIWVGNSSNVATAVAMSGDATIANTGAVTVADDSHAHTTTTISGIDISDDTNLAGDTEIVLTDDTLSIASTITRDTEWDTFAEINSATTDTDAVLDTDIGSTVQAYDADLTAIAGLANTDSNFIVGNGSTWVAESGSTVRTSLGLGSLATLSTVNNGNWSGTDLSVANGGTGRSTSTTAYGLIAAGTTATGAHQTLSAGATTEILVGGGASALPVWTTATGTGSPVRATSPTLVTPAIGDATATTQSADDNDTSVATTAYVQGEINGAGGTNLTCSSGVCNVDDAFLLNNGDVGTGVYDFGGATTFEIRNATNCAGDTTEGQICWDSDDDALYVGDGTTASAIGGGGASGWTDNGATVNSTTATDNFIIGSTTGSAGTSSQGVLGLVIGTAPTASSTDTVQLYALDVSSGLSSDQVPDMTSLTTPSGTVSVSGTYSTGYGWNAVTDDGTASQWLLGATSGWWQYDFGSGNDKAIVGYTLMVNTTGRAPYDWTIEASSTGAYAGEEVVLDTVVSDTSWTSGVAKQYTFENSTAYRYWRIDITNSGGASGLTEIAELELFVSLGTSAELKVRDEAGNVTTLSPHNQTLIPKEKKDQIEQASDGLGWTYYSCKEDKCINVDMFSAIRLIEKFSGEQLIYSTKANIDRTPGEVTVEDLKALKAKDQPQP